MFYNVHPIDRDLRFLGRTNHALDKRSLPLVILLNLRQRNQHGRKDMRQALVSVYLDFVPSVLESLCVSQPLISQRI